MGITDQVRALYERRPYPPVSLLTPFVQFVRRGELSLLRYGTGFEACFGTIPEKEPRILVVGSGTLEPVAVAAANPGARILAVDLSEKSLKRLRWNARWKGVSSRIETRQGDFQELPVSLGPFDYVIASGVIHHLEDPGRGLRVLHTLGHERAVYRFMIYSHWGRELLYGAKSLAALFGVESPERLRLLLEALPADHPYRIYFHLYEDARTDAGLVDGYLHPCDRPFDAEELGALLESSGLEAAKFFQREDAVPGIPSDVSPWRRTALLDSMGALDENFRFFACWKRGSE